MKTDLKQWKTLYEIVHNLGWVLKNATHDKYGNTPIINMNLPQKKAIEREIEILMKQSGLILDKLNLIPKEALWKNKEEELL